MMKVRWLLLSILLGVVLAAEARGERLQKYDIPQIAPPVVQRPAETSPVFLDFERQIQGLSWDDKKKLLDSFVERGRDAAQQNNPAEAQYYDELSRILLRNMNR